MTEKKHKVITCPRAKSDMTPCAARDGKLAVYDSEAGHMRGHCVGCGRNVAELFKELVAKYVEHSDA